MSRIESYPWAMVIRRPHQPTVFRIELRQEKLGTCYIEADSRDIAIQQFYLHLDEFTDEVEWDGLEITIIEICEEEEEEEPDIETA